jgi:hypothetical protein
VSGRNSHVSQSAAISKAMEARPHAEAVREHLSLILKSPAFKGSERSREFLVVIVEKALAGRFEELKERVLGVELFGRHTSYDTGEDAVVRVTASDVRKRLLRYYSESGVNSDLRLEIPIGSYIPDFHWNAPEPVVEGPVPAMEPEAALDIPAAVPVAPRERLARRPLLYVTAGFVLGLLVCAIGIRLLARGGEVEGLPWSSLLQKGRRLQIILSDTEISRMQTVVGYSLSLPDYANHKYLPPDIHIPPDLDRILGSFRGLSMGATDVSVALSVAKRAFPNSLQVSFLPARSVQLKDFRTDDNFLMLGSPRSNPWVSLFQDQLDFQFFYDAPTSREVIRNLKPRKGELPIYRPSARGYDTGEAFGIVAFLGNPNQNGHVLLLAGSSAEATEAAAKFVLNRETIANLLKVNGISPAANPVSFQILLRVNTMAGSANTFEAVAFHRLSAGEPS